MDKINSSDDIFKSGTLEILRALVDTIQRSEEYCVVADFISKYIGDREWEIKLYQIAENVAVSYGQFLKLADIISSKDYLIDEIWFQRVMKKAALKAEEFHELIDMAEYLIQNKEQTYKQLGIKFYKKAARNLKNDPYSRASDKYFSLASSLVGNMKELPLTDEIIRLGKKKEIEKENWEETIYLAREIGDQEWADKAISLGEQTANFSSDYTRLAKTIINADQNISRAVELFRKSESWGNSFPDFHSLAREIYNASLDMEWVGSLYHKAEDLAEQGQEYLLIAHEVKKLSDKKWLRSLLHKAAEHQCDLFDLGEMIMSELGDDKWAREVFRQLENTAEESIIYTSMGNIIFQRLNDKKWAAELFERAENSMRGTYDGIFLAASIIENLNDYERARKILSQAQEFIQEICDYYDLSVIIAEKLHDLHWALDFFRVGKEVERKEGSHILIQNCALKAIQAILSELSSKKG